MTPSKEAKLAGLKSLAEMSRLAKVPVSTLNYQFRHCPELWAMNLARALKRLLSTHQHDTARLAE